MSADTSQATYYWSDFVGMTHKEQVSLFDWCSCEDNEGNENPYADCPRPELATSSSWVRILFWKLGLK
jgi:hypothetical protein